MCTLNSIMKLRKASFDNFGAAGIFWSSTESRPSCSAQLERLAVPLNCDHTVPTSLSARHFQRLLMGVMDCLDASDVQGGANGKRDEVFCHPHILSGD